MYLWHWNIPEDSIKDKGKIDKMEISISTSDSFDFSDKEVIYFYPWNLGDKIDDLEFTISFPENLEQIYVQLFEVGKIKGKNSQCISLFQ
ncbi:hypothetical protein [Blautia glucerasea]|uniref:hypothetical protein n=1 Tax=Blautia glucerasea TaxID=536633 RepID=UPI001D08AFF9|nr:hypothetical protein [Blautia glucerasea]MCB6545893.1 hypothetical protein [Blautia glucerasea]